MHIAGIILLVWSAVLSVPIFVFALECALGLLFAKRGCVGATAESRPSVAVLIPAHDEEAVIARTIASIHPQLRQTDRLIVIADNCSDRTCDVARANGAEVIERHDENLRGKGYAMDCGVRHLENNPPRVVLFVDADCELDADTVDVISTVAQSTGRPVQALYLMNPPPDPSLKDLISAFAVQVKNQVRAAGIAQLGVPCGLTGTGMAFPWDIIHNAPLATAHITEDAKLGLELALCGSGALLVNSVTVRGMLGGGKAAVSQRRRWEHGTMKLATEYIPRLLIGGLSSFRPALWFIALDLAVPPLSLLCFLWAITLALGVALRVAGGIHAPLLVSIVGGAALIGVVFAAWASQARSYLPLKSLLSAPFYVLWKLPLYVSFLFRREKSWIRTHR